MSDTKNSGYFVQNEFDFEDQHQLGDKRDPKKTFTDTEERILARKLGALNKHFHLEELHATEGIPYAKIAASSRKGIPLSLRAQVFHKQNNYVKSKKIESIDTLLRCEQNLPLDILKSYHPFIKNLAPDSFLEMRWVRQMRKWYRRNPRKL